MSTPTFYPPIEAKNLSPFRSIRALLDKDPAYLDNPACPYDQETKGFLKLMLGAPGGAPAVALETAEDLEKQLNEIYSGLVQFGNQQGLKDQSDRIAWAKAVTGILDKVITLKERTINMKNYSDFQKRVLTVLDGLLTPAQRTDFVDQLGKYINQ
jgi:hypothetical protein